MSAAVSYPTAGDTVSTTTTSALRKWSASPIARTPNNSVKPAVQAAEARLPRTGALKPANTELDPFVEHAHKLFSGGFED
jgi:hypothetical protein